MSFQDDIQKAIGARRAAIGYNLGLNDGDDLEKGGKRANIGEIRTHGGKQMVKTATGWHLYVKGNEKSSIHPLLEEQLDKIHPDPKNWSDADDLARDLTRTVRETYNDYNNFDEDHPEHHHSLDWRSISKQGPKAWNQAGLTEVKKIWEKSSDEVKGGILRAIKRD